MHKNSTRARVALGRDRAGQDGRFLHVNRAATELYGYAPEEMLALDVWRMTHPDDLDASQVAVRRLRRSEPCGR